MVTIKSKEGVSPREKSEFLKLVAKATKLCAVERRREGKALENSLEKYLNDLQKLLARMESFIEGANRDMQKRFMERFAKSPFGEKVDAERLAQEVAVYLDRCDVSEEIERLREHLRHCRQLLKAPGATGKKLDFYSQELLREVNTIGSKSQLAPMTELVVESKGLIEKIKEQVQNVE